MAEKEEQKGLFFDTLNRSGKEVLRDRASDIVTDTKYDYEYALRQAEKEIRDKKAEQKSNMDLSPISKDALSFQNTFKAGDWVQRDINLTVEIAKLELKYEALLKRFKEVYG
jgi:hypothetical protein